MRKILSCTFFLFKILLLYPLLSFVSKYPYCYPIAIRYDLSFHGWARDVKTDGIKCSSDWNFLATIFDRLRLIGRALLRGKKVHENRVLGRGWFEVTRDSRARIREGGATRRNEQGGRNEDLTVTQLRGGKKGC